MKFDFEYASAWIHNHLFLFDEYEINLLESLIEWANQENVRDIVAGTRLDKFRKIIMVVCRGKEGWPYVRGEEE
jgi:hypothetical protein|tara:strand:+ start:65 stop:286 length:222 start_codon:yes stop_codon:yes gene_type:complete